MANYRLMGNQILILRVKEFFEKNKGKSHKFNDITKGLKISDNMLLEIIGVLQREEKMPLKWA